MPSQVRRMLQQNGTYICGMCRTSSAERARIISCFQKCIAKLLSPPLIRHEKQNSAHVCLVCERSYKFEGDAKECANQCCEEIKAYQESLTKGIPKGYDAAFFLQQWEKKPTKKNEPNKALPTTSHLASESSESQVEKLQLAKSKHTSSEPDVLSDFDDSLELGVAKKAG